MLDLTGDVHVQLVLDRSIWTIEIDGFDPDLWRAALEGTDPTDPMALDAQAEWVGANLGAIRRAAADARHGRAPRRDGNRPRRALVRLGSPGALPAPLPRAHGRRGRGARPRS